MKKMSNVTIKGTKDGLTLHLDDSCSFEELKVELDKKLSNNTRPNEERPTMYVKVQVGNRYLNDEQFNELVNLIRQKKNLDVDEIVSNVITIDEAEKMRAATDIVTVAKMVRSGQVVEVEGDLLLIGDVNPGGSVIASGNIYILGALKGIAHAGKNGNDQAVITASVMKPAQLRISGCSYSSPDQPVEESKVSECAYIDENRQIGFDKIQALTHLRPNLNRL